MHDDLDEAASAVAPDTLSPGAVEHLLEDVNYALNVSLPDVIDQWTGDPVALANLAHGLRVLIKNATVLYQKTEDDLIESMPLQEWLHPDLGVIEYRSASQRKKWDHDAVWTAVTRYVQGEPTVTFDFDSGEMLDPIHNEEDRQRVIANVISYVRKFTSSPSWKVGRQTSPGVYDGGLRGAGIDPDEFCETTWSRRTINWHDSE